MRLSTLPIHLCSAAAASTAQSIAAPVLNCLRNAEHWEVAKPAKQKSKKDIGYRQNGSSTQWARFGAGEEARSTSCWRTGADPALTWPSNLDSGVWRSLRQAAAFTVSLSRKLSRSHVVKQPLRCAST